MAALGSIRIQGRESIFFRVPRPSKRSLSQHESFKKGPWYHGIKYQEPWKVWYLDPGTHMQWYTKAPKSVLGTPILLYLAAWIPRASTLWALRTDPRSWSELLAQTTDRGPSCGGRCPAVSAGCRAFSCHDLSFSYSLGQL